MAHSLFGTGSDGSQTTNLLDSPKSNPFDIPDRRSDISNPTPLSPPSSNPSPTWRRVVGAMTTLGRSSPRPHSFSAAQHSPTTLPPNTQDMPSSLEASSPISSPASSQPQDVDKARSVNKSRPVSPLAKYRIDPASNQSLERSLAMMYEEQGRISQHKLIQAELGIRHTPSSTPPLPDHANSRTFAHRSDGSWTRVQSSSRASPAVDSPQKALAEPPPSPPLTGPSPDPNLVEHTVTSSVHYLTQPSALPPTPTATPASPPTVVRQSSTTGFTIDSAEHRELMNMLSQANIDLSRHGSTSFNVAKMRGLEQMMKSSDFTAQQKIGIEAQLVKLLNVMDFKAKRKESRRKELEEQENENESEERRRKESREQRKKEREQRIEEAVQADSPARKELGVAASELIPAGSLLPARSRSENLVVRDGETFYDAVNDNPVEQSLDSPPTLTELASRRSEISELPTPTDPTLTPAPRPACAHDFQPSFFTMEECFVPTSSHEKSISPADGAWLALTGMAVPRQGARKGYRYDRFQNSIGMQTSWGRHILSPIESETLSLQANSQHSSVVTSATPNQCATPAKVHEPVSPAVGRLQSPLSQDDGDIPSPRSLDLGAELENTKLQTTRVSLGKKTAYSSKLTTDALEAFTSQVGTNSPGSPSSSLDWVEELQRWRRNTTREKDRERRDSAPASKTPYRSPTAEISSPSEIDRVSSASVPPVLLVNRTMSPGSTEPIGTGELALETFQLSSSEEDQPTPKKETHLSTTRLLAHSPSDPLAQENHQLPLGSKNTTVAAVEVLPASKDRQRNSSAPSVLDALSSPTSASSVRFAWPSRRHGMRPPLEIPGLEVPSISPAFNTVYRRSSGYGKETDPPVHSPSLSVASLESAPVDGYRPRPTLSRRLYSTGFRQPALTEDEKAEQKKLRREGLTLDWKKGSFSETRYGQRDLYWKQFQKFSEEERRLQNWLQEAPHNAQVLNALGELYSSVPMREIRESALAYFHQAINIDPSQARVWSNLSQSLESFADFDGADRALQRATAIDPENPVYRWMTARLFLNRNKIELARGTLLTSLEKDSTGTYGVISYYTLGLIFEYRLAEPNILGAHENYKLALACYDAAVTADDLQPSRSLPSREEIVRRVSQTEKLLEDIEPHPDDIYATRPPKKSSPTVLHDSSSAPMDSMDSPRSVRRVQQATPVTTSLGDAKSPKNAAPDSPTSTACSARSPSMRESPLSLSEDLLCGSSELPSRLLPTKWVEEITSLSAVRKPGDLPRVALDSTPSRSRSGKCAREVNVQTQSASTRSAEVQTSRIWPTAHEIRDQELVRIRGLAMAKEIAAREEAETLLKAETEEEEPKKKSPSRKGRSDAPSSRSKASSHTVESYYPALIAALEELNTLAAVWAAGSPTPSEYEADTKKMVETMQELNASLSPVEPTLEMNVVKALRSLAETVDALPGRMMHAATALATNKRRPAGSSSARTQAQAATLRRVHDQLDVLRIKMEEEMYARAMARRKGEASSV